MRDGWTEGAARDDPGSAGRWLLGFFGVAGGALLGFLIMKLEFRYVLLLAGGLAVPVLIASRPLLGLTALLAGTTFLSFYNGGLPQLRIKSIQVPDLLLALLYGLAAWRWLKGRLHFVPTPLAAPYFAWLGASLISLACGVLLGGANFLEAFREFKVLIYYSPFFLVPALADSAPRLKTLLALTLALAVAASLNLVAGAILRPPSTSASGEEFYYSFRGLLGEGGGLLIYWGLCAVFALFLFSGLSAAGLTVFGTGLLFYLLKFHRHMYIIIALSLAALALLAYRGNEARTRRVGLLAGVAALLLGVLIAWGPRTLSDYATLSVKRLESLQGIRSTSTVTFRLLENRHALAAIRASPLVGIGFAKSYRPPIYGPDDRMNTFVHNGYLWILLKTGWLGFACFLWFSWRFLRRSFGGWRTVRDPVLRAVVLGSAVAYAGLAAANTTSPYFMQDWSVAAIGLMAGLTEGALRFGGRAGEGGAA